MEEVNTHTAASKTGQISFVGLFGNEINGKTINKIEIPLIQRDYAQGRQGEIVMLWEYRGNDSLVDDEFMRYFTFITDIFVWYHDQLDPNLSRDDLEAKIYGEPQSEPIHFLMNAFDIWINPNGELQSLSSLGFNQEQIQDEIRKKVFLQQHPHLQDALFALEDHPLLRGGLTAFTLDAESFAENAAAFPLLFEKSNWLELTGALLTKDNYGRHRPRGDRVSVAFGSSKNAQAWQDLFRGRNRENPHTINRALMEVLKDFHDKCNSPSALVSMQLDFLSDTNTLKDWRYYFVKYPVMRSAPQGA